MSAIKIFIFVDRVDTACPQSESQEETERNTLPLDFSD
jgi:hypothetical protein